MSETITLNADGTLQGLGEVHLTGREFALLLAVANRKGSILTKQAGLTELYGGINEPEIKIINVFICKVRAKLLKVGVPYAIETVWGQGYRWNKDVKLLTPDGNFVFMEVSTKFSQRIEDLALAVGCDVSAILYRIVAENIGQYEDEVWA